MFVDDGVLVGVDVVGKGAGRGSPEMGKELVFGIEGDNREGEFLEGRSGQGRRGNSGNRGFNDGGQEVLNWDLYKWDAVGDFLKLKMDVYVLSFNGWGILELWA